MRARIVDADLIKPPPEIHLVMTRLEAEHLRDILCRANMGPAYQALAALLGPTGSK